MDKFKKIDREFLLSDSSLNCYSYRLLTSGYLMDEYKKNPIGYWMHGLSAEYPREMGVLVKWEDVRKEGDKVFGKPCINLNHARGQRTVDEIESGFLNAASFGHMVALEISTDPADYLQGQTGPTIKKWYNRECSLVDIPGNYNALAENLFDANDQPINLADFNTQNFIMKQIILTPALMALIPNLKADADQATAETALQNLIAEAAKVPNLTAQLATANTDKETAEQKLKDLQAETTEKDVDNQLAVALKETRITKEASTQLKTQFAGKPVELKALLATMQPYTGVVKSIDGAAKNLTDLIAKDYDTLDKENKLEALKAGAPDEFFAKYETKFNKKHPADPKNKA